MAIQWFPGHMKRAQQAISKLVEDIDIVIELLDARAPLSSCNPLIQGIIRFKRKIRILNKSDLADLQTNQAWLNYFNKTTQTSAILGNKDNKKQRERIIQMCHELAPARGTSFEKPLRIMITGIPNVGKSTLINQLVGKKLAKTGDIPALTRANQRVYLNDNFIIYDTPGIMWQKINYMQIGFHLALCNSIGRNALDEELIGLYLLEFLQNSGYADNVAMRYKLKTDAMSLTTDELFNAIALKRGCIMSGGVIDRQKISEIIIQDFRDGKLGKITLETPTMWERWLEEFVAEENQQINASEIEEPIC